MKRITMALALMLLTGVYGCAHKTEIPPTAAQPAAMGKAEATTDPNGNTRVRLAVQHVAPPQNLQPPKNAYVVWIETPDNRMYNFGQLRIDDNREGKIEGITPLKVFRLVVTAEDFGTVTTPSPQVVLSTKPIEVK